MAPIDVAWRVLARVGEIECGDAVLVRTEGERRLVAVVDALGHGPTAAAVAARATLCLADCQISTDVASLMASLHEALRSSRGAAITLLGFDGLEMEGCMVGNVDLRAVGMRVPMVALSGVVGTRLPKLRTFRTTVVEGARLFVHSDGISRRAPFDELARRPAADACDAIVATHRHDHDDATILAIYAGTSPASELPPRTR